MQDNPIVDSEAWTAARKALLAREKELTHRRDALAAERRALPWMRVEKEYAFDTPQGRRTLAELFDGRSQLIVQHFMMGPGWTAGCPGCSFQADHVDAAWKHLRHHDVTYVAVARAPLAEIDAYWRRMGWRFPFASSFGSDFNHDFHVSFTPDELAGGQVFYNFELTEASVAELPGSSVFTRSADGGVCHTYSSYGRGGEEAIGAYMLLDITPRGRNESGPMDWVRRHDEYAAPPAVPA